MFFFLYLFTFWVIILCIFDEYTHKYVNLLYLTFVTLVIGMYISYVHPRYFHYPIDNDVIKFEGFTKFYIIDLFSHIIPFIYIVYKYKSYYSSISLADMPFTFLILIMYYILLNTETIYGINKQELVLLFVGSTMLYFLL